MKQKILGGGGGGLSLSLSLSSLFVVRFFFFVVCFGWSPQGLTVRASYVTTYRRLGLKYLFLRHSVPSFTVPSGQPNNNTHFVIKSSNAVLLPFVDSNYAIICTIDSHKNPQQETSDPPKKNMNMVSNTNSVVAQLLVVVATVLMLAVRETASFTSISTTTTVTKKNLHTNARILHQHQRLPVTTSLSSTTTTSSSSSSSPSSIESTEQAVEKLKKVLEREYVSFFDPMERSWYATDVSFTDPMTSLSGVDAYQGNVDMVCNG